MIPFEYLCKEGLIKERSGGLRPVIGEIGSKGARQGAPRELEAPLL